MGWEFGKHPRKIDLPVRIFWKAASTFPPSKADVSMNDNPFSAEKALASSVGTARRCLRSDLLPTSMMTMFYQKEITR